GQHLVVLDGDVIRIYRRRPVPGDDPWLEDAERRGVQVPLWHDAEAAAADKRGNAFAADFHRRRLAAGDNLRVLAWARLAGGDAHPRKQAVQRLREEQQGLASLPAALAWGLAAQPNLAQAAAAVAARHEERRRAAVLVRAAALMPHSGIPGAELVVLA